MISIRQVTEDDWASWRAVRLSALAEAPYAFSSTLADWTGAQDSEQKWRSRLLTVPFNLLAFLDGEAVGMASATAVAEDAVELISMWVSPVTRGKGAGDALIEEISDWAYRQGASRLCLNVRLDNHHALALYERNGFFRAGIAAGPDEQLPELKMIRQLT
ncbi:MAG: N-acetyltransferase family protein [Acidimicrobiales bacterium]|jgi:ribosomal protein S18 acetylase RimI-like enzyme